MSKSILITGLILGKETEMCLCTNVNYDWLFLNPSNLLWADSVIVTRNEWKQICEYSGDSPYMKTVCLVFKKLQEKGLIEIISDSEINLDTAKILQDEVIADLDLLSDLITEDQDNGETMMLMGEHHYCIPALWTLYASIYLSFFHGASFSLMPHELSYLSVLLPRKYNTEIKAGRNVAIEEIMGLYLPKMELGHPIIHDYKNGRCEVCKNLELCKDNFLLDAEKQLDNILEVREYDEIRMTCEVLDKIIDRNASIGTTLTGEEIWDDLQEEASKVEKKVKRVMRKITMWQKLSTFASIGLSASSFISPPLGLAAAVPASAAAILSDKLKQLEKQMSWVNFVYNPESILSKKPSL